MCVCVQLTLYCRVRLSITVGKRRKEVTRELFTLRLSLWYIGSIERSPGLERRDSELRGERERERERKREAHVLLSEAQFCSNGWREQL